MKHVLLILAAVAMLAAVNGCRVPGGQCGTGLITGSCTDCPENCASCGDCGCNQYNQSNCTRCSGDPVCAQACPPGGPNYGSFAQDPRFTPGPASGAIAYPYYTTHGPRDFLASGPRSLGP